MKLSRLVLFVMIALTFGIEHTAAQGTPSQFGDLLIDAIGKNDVSILEKGLAGLPQIDKQAVVDIGTATPTFVLPTTLALMAHNKSILKFLLDEKFAVNPKDRSGLISPLYLAIQENDLESAKILLESGAQAGAMDPSGTDKLVDYSKTNSTNEVFELLRTYYKKQDFFGGLFYEGKKQQ